MFAFQKIAAVSLGLVAGAVATGCAVGAASDEDLGSQEAAFTYVTDGVCATHIQVAAEIARATMAELGRFRPGLDLVVTNGKVALTAAGEARCVARGGCTVLKSLLSYQNLTRTQSDALATEFPFLQHFQATSLSTALGASVSAATSPDQVIEHELTYHHTSPAPAITNCGDLLYHCFTVSGLPAGKTIDDLAQNFRDLFASHNELSAMTRVSNEGGYLCIDPDGTGDDHTGGGSTGGSVCVDGAMLLLYDPTSVGDCCSLPTGNGYLVQNLVDPGYMSCKTTNLAAGKVATASSSLTSNPPSFATDAEPDTLWSAATSNANEWLKVDLGSSQSIKGVVFEYEQPGTYGYKVETSATGVTWALKKTGTSTGVTHQDANFSAATARYVRITFTSLPTGRSAAIGSVRVY